MRRRSLLIEYLVCAGLAALIIVILLTISISDFQKDRAHDLRDPAGLIGFIAFLHVLLFSSIPIGLLYLWGLRSRLVSRDMTDAPAKPKTGGSSTSGPDSERGGSFWIWRLLGAFIVSSVLSVTLVSALIAGPLDSMSLVDFWDCVVLVTPLTLAPAVFMVLRRILLVVALPLGRMFSACADAVRRRRDAMLEVLDRFLGIKPKP